MKLEEQRMKLKKCRDSRDFYDLYKQVFKEEVPETQTRSPNDLLDMIAQAIHSNQKIKEVPLEKGALI